MLSKLWKYIEKKRRIQLFLSSILILLSSLAEFISIASLFPFITALSNTTSLFNISIIKQVSFYFGIKDPSSLLVPLTILFIFGIVISSLTRLLSQWLNARIAALIATDLSVSGFERTLYQPYKVHLYRNSSEIISIHSNEINRVENVIKAVLEFIANLIFSLSIIVTLFFFSPRISISVAFILGSIYIIIAILTRDILAKNSKLISKADNRKINSLQEGMGSIREILLSSIQPFFVSRLLEADSSVRNTVVTNSMISLLPRYAIETFGITILALFSLIYSFNPEYKEPILPIIATFALGAQKLLPSMHRCFSSLTYIRGMITSLENILKMLSQEIKNHKQFNTVKPYILKNDIVFDDVSFCYENNDIHVLKNINLKIRKGEKIGIIGKTGSGKSTLLDLILGLIEPSTGQILIDSFNLHDQSFQNGLFLESWQNSISHVPQNIFLIDSSIKENIALGIPPDDIDNSTIKNTIDKSMLNEFVSHLPRGAETFVGERGVNLSGGQMQRIGIARALYKKSKILILDEATSALDTSTESKLIQAINYLDPELTLIMIAHRTSTLKSCDKIYSVDSQGINIKFDRSMS